MKKRWLRIKDQWFDPIIDFYEDTIEDSYRYLFKVIPRRVGRIFRWLPTLWSFESWDYSHMYAHFNLALIEMKNFYAEPNGVMSCEEHRLWVHKQLTILSGIMERLQQGDYDQAFYNKLPKSTMNSVKIQNSIYHRVSFDFKSEADEKLHARLLDIHIKREQALIKQDFALFGKILAKSQRFWD